MNTKILPLLALLVLGTLSACSTATVTTNFDRSATFGKYKTYTLAPAPHGQKLSPQSEEELRDAIRRQLANRGITESKTGKGDLAIVWHVFVNDKISERQYADWGYNSGFGSNASSGWPYGYGAYDMWTGAPSTYTEVKTYHEGTLILDVVDTHTNKLVFRGTATAVVGGQRNNARNIEIAVAKMVAALPTKR